MILFPDGIYGRPGAGNFSFPSLTCAKTYFFPFAAILLGYVFRHIFELDLSTVNIFPAPFGSGTTTTPLTAMLALHA